VQELLDFLGADPHPRQLRPLDVTVKQTRDPLEGHVSNYDDVRFAFKCTRISKCFNT